ncbi:MAG: signal peptide peptidase SppA [Alphaproteobacteria bacterium]|nr:signal peptide peptidase SppA [Alphaproteobacteria bacterium]
MRKIIGFIKSVCTVLGAMVLICGIGAVLIRFYNGKAIEIPKHTMLMIDFGHNFSEVQTDGLLNELLDRQGVSFTSLIQSIEMAAGDERIDGIVARIDVSGLELAQIQDVARAVEVFKQSGKKTYVFSQGFGPFGQGNREYYLATFFDKIYMQPHTYIGLTGIGMELPFARDILDKVGIYPEYYTRYEYKTAMMSFTDKNISEPYKVEMTRLGNSLMNELKSGIWQNRDISATPETVINQAPLSAEEGKKLNLIDDVLYLPQVEKLIKEEGVENFVAVEDYATQIHPNEGNLPAIAILNLSGIIDAGENSTDIDGEFTIGSKSVLADLADIEDIENLKAVVVRIDSPGGSYNAADEIYFALKDLKQNKNVPIIVSQSGYAASGGYFISLAGDVIIAEPTTITGSIGVLGGKFVLQELWQKLGVEWANIKIGQNADILSVNKPFTAEERQIFNASLDEVYRDFTQKVVENRPLKQNIDKIARGRVWTGQEALELGLIDMLGGLSQAITVARDKGGIVKGEKFKIVSFPREKSFSDKIRELLIQSKINVTDVVAQSGVDIRYLKLFKRLQYDTVLTPFEIKM